MTALVATTPWHFRLSCGRGRYPGSQAVPVRRMPDRTRWVAFPGRRPSGGMTHLALAYRCGGSTGIAASMMKRAHLFPV